MTGLSSSMRVGSDLMVMYTKRADSAAAQAIPDLLRAWLEVERSTPARGTSHSTIVVDSPGICSRMRRDRLRIGYDGCWLGFAEGPGYPGEQPVADSERRVFDEPGHKNAAERGEDDTDNGIQQPDYR